MMLAIPLGTFLSLFAQRTKCDIFSQCFAALPDSVAIDTALFRSKVLCVKGHIIEFNIHQWDFRYEMIFSFAQDLRIRFNELTQNETIWTSAKKHTKIWTCFEFMGSLFSFGEKKSILCREKLAAKWLRMNGPMASSSSVFPLIFSFWCNIFSHNSVSKVVLWWFIGKWPFAMQFTKLTRINWVGISYFHSEMSSID